MVVSFVCFFSQCILPICYLSIFGFCRELNSNRFQDALSGRRSSLVEFWHVWLLPVLSLWMLTDNGSNYILIVPWDVFHVALKLKWQGFYVRSVSAIPGSVRKTSFSCNAILMPNFYWLWDYLSINRIKGLSSSLTFVIDTQHWNECSLYLWELSWLHSVFHETQECETSLSSRADLQFLFLI